MEKYSPFQKFNSIFTDDEKKEKSSYSQANQRERQSQIWSAFQMAPTLFIKQFNFIKSMIKR